MSDSSSGIVVTLQGWWNRPRLCVAQVETSKTEYTSHCLVVGNKEHTRTQTLVDTNKICLDGGVSAEIRQQLYTIHVSMFPVSKLNMKRQGKQLKNPLFLQRSLG